jgi:hypothetical protein
MGRFINRRVHAPFTRAQVSLVGSHPFARKNAKGWGTGLFYTVNQSDPTLRVWKNLALPTHV